MRKARLRLAWLLWGGLVLAWLPIEDSGFIYPFGLGVLAAIWAFLQFMAAKANILSRTKRWIFGALIGISSHIISAFLMIFKSGIHGHGFPDFPINSLLEMMRLWPITFLAGLLSALLWEPKAELVTKIEGKFDKT